VGNHAASLLRPNWVFHVAREVNRFVQSAGQDGIEPSCVDRFFSTLPRPECELESQLLHELRCRLTRQVCNHHVSRPAERARQLLTREYRKPWVLAELARAVGCNRTTLQEKFRRLTGMSVHTFLVRQRVSAAKQLLVVSDLKVTRIADEVGYRSHSAFARHFKNVTGATLTQYRARRRG
jgi:AraC-like DNA-binding protein